MAGGAGCRETGCDVIGVCGTGEVGLVAGVAVCWNRLEVVVGVALGAGCGEMGASEREGTF